MINFIIWIITPFLKYFILFQLISYNALRKHYNNMELIGTENPYFLHILDADLTTSNNTLC